MADSKELIHFRDTVLNTKSKSFCGAKWGNSTLWLNSGETASCHLPPVHKIDVVQIQSDPSKLHNTDHKTKMREMMKKGEKPSECDYCWKVESMGPDFTSDRVFKSLQFSPEEMKELKDITLNEKFSNGEGNEKQIENFQQVYKDDLINGNKINKKLKAVVACGNGTAGVFAPDILRGIGCEVIELDCNLDWTFPKYNPNPEDLEMLHAIAKAVKDNDADIGFGFDGDGDRVGVIDDKGNEIFSDKIGLLIARNLSAIHKNSKFIVDVKSTGLYATDKVLSDNNCETIYWKTGHSHIKRKVNTEKALAGFEKSGHFFFNQPLGFGYDDGINSAIHVCHLLDNQNKMMSEIINELPNTFQTPTMAPFCKDEEKYQVVEGLVKQIEEIKDNKTKIDDQIITEILTVNGVRFSFEDGSWGLIRASSNKPSLVIVTESPTSDNRKKKIFDFIDNLLQKSGKVGEYDQKI